MADRNGYIGRAPSDSSVVVARQLFEPTGITTTFTFAAGYTVGYLDVYLNGARLIEGRDYTASSGSTVDLDSAATSGDVLELVAYKAFNATTIDTAPGNLSVGNNLTVDGYISAGGTVTGSAFYGDGSNLTGISYASTAGIATYSESAGIATYASTAGIATYASTAGIATYASTSGIATYSESAGIATYASTSGIATSLLGGNAGVNTTSTPTNLYVSGNAASNIVGLGTTDANTALDFSTGNNFSLTLTGSIVLTDPTGITTGQSGIVLIQQDGVGNHTVGFGSHWDFPSATVPNLSTDANALDALTYFVRNSTSIVTNSLIGIGTL